MTAEATATRDADPATRRRVAARLRRELHRINARDFFPPPQREQATRAVDDLAAETVTERPAQPAIRARPVKWATRARIHVDRAASAWLIRRFVDPDAEFVFVTDPADVPPDATAFDMRGVALSHHHGTLHLRNRADPASTSPPTPRWRRSGASSTRPTSPTSTFDAPVAAGLDVLIRGLTLTHDTDQATLAVTDRLFDGLYEHLRQRLLRGRPPA